VGRILVVVLFGPQNKLLDIWWYRPLEKEKHNLRKLLAERLNMARYSQEDALKLRAFRHALFGKYSTQVPSILWTPHQDFPLPSSTARLRKNRSARKSQFTNRSKLVPGQELFGNMIPQPQMEYERTNGLSRQFLRGMDQALKANERRIKDEKKRRKSKKLSLVSSELGGIGKDASESTPLRTSLRMRESLRLQEEGFEIAEMYDEEAGYVENVLKPFEQSQGLQESMYELGVEIVGTASADGEERFQSTYRGQSTKNIVKDEESDDGNNSIVVEEAEQLGDDGEGEVGVKFEEEKESEEKKQSFDDGRDGDGDGGMVDTTLTQQQQQQQQQQQHGISPKGRSETSASAHPSISKLEATVKSRPSSQQIDEMPSGISATSLMEAPQATAPVPPRNVGTRNSSYMDEMGFEITEEFDDGNDLVVEFQSG